MAKLTPAQGQLRQNVRNFLLIATIPELERELEISEGDRKTYVQELQTRPSPKPPKPDTTN